MRIAPRTTPTHCYGHFCRQAGLGNSGFFQGTRYQRGSGLLSTFRNINISPYFLPILKQAALSAGKYLLRKGGEFLSDVRSGIGAKTAARERLGEVKSDFLKNVMGQQSGTGRKRKKRKATITAPFPHSLIQTGSRRSVRRTGKRCCRKGKGKRKKRDIFD